MIEQCAHCELNTAGEHAWNCPLSPIQAKVATKIGYYESGRIQTDNPALLSEIKRLARDNAQLQSEVTRQRSEIDLLKPQ